MRLFGSEAAERSRQNRQRTQREALSKTRRTRSLLHDSGTNSVLYEKKHHDAAQDVAFVFQNSMGRGTTIEKKRDKIRVDFTHCLVQKSMGVPLSK